MPPRRRVAPDILQGHFHGYPLPRTPGELAALASVLPRGDFKWVPVPLDVAPSTEDRIGQVRFILGVGALMIGDLYRELRIQAVLLDTRETPHIERRLVYAGSRQPVAFDDMNCAANALEATDNTGAALPSNWDWDPPPLGPLGGEWTPGKVDRSVSYCGNDTYERVGTTARWRVERYLRLYYVVKKNGRLISNQRFTTAAEAMRFCEGQDP